MIRFHTRLAQSAVLVFDPVDVFLQGLRFVGPFPRPRGRIEFDIIAKYDGAAFVNLDEVLLLRTKENTSGYHLFFGELRPSGERGEISYARTERLQGRYKVRVRSDLYLPIELDVEIPQRDPRRPIDVFLSPGSAYPFPTGNTPLGKSPTYLRGAVQNPDGTGIADFDVLVRLGPPFAQVQTKTDESGQWVIAFGGNTALPASVDVTLWKGSTRYADTIPLTAGETNRWKRTALLGRAVTGDGVPVSEASIAVAGVNGTSRSVSDGRWMFVLPPDQVSGTLNVTVTSSDGRRNKTEPLSVVRGQDVAADKDFVL